MDEKEYLTPDTKSFDEQYGQMMREQLEQLRREKSDEAKVNADSTEDTPYEDVGNSYDEANFDDSDVDDSDFSQETVHNQLKNQLHYDDRKDFREISMVKEGFEEEMFSQEDFGKEEFGEAFFEKEEEESDGHEYIEEDEVKEDSTFVGEDNESDESDQEEQEEESPKRLRKRRRKRHGCAIIIYSILTITVLVIVANTPLFAVHKINVKGNKDYTKKQVVAMSGVQKGDNLFRIHKGSIRKRLVNNSYIREVNLTRTLPDTITITVKERKAMAYLPYGSKNIVIDVNGYVLKVVNKRPKLVKIADMSIKSMEVGKPIAVSNEGKLKESLEILKLMKQGNLFFKEIKPGRVVMQLCVYDHLFCKGTKNNLAHAMKSGTLQGIISDLYKKNVNKGTINVGHGEYISFSPKANP